MNKNEVRRNTIFKKFSKQLHEIVADGLYNIDLKYEQTYVCPICLNQYSIEDLKTEVENHLTLEDAPPYSLGGKANTLTCKKCNNESGHKIDFHLVELLNEKEIRNFLPNTETKVTMEHGGQKVQGILKIDNEGTITVNHLLKSNNPTTLKNYVEKTGKDDTPDLYFKTSRVEAKKVEVALLKSAYILAFEHYGYSLILSSAFDVVRQQILNPDDDIYPIGFWSKQSNYTEENSGVHVITSKGYEGIMSIFILETANKNKSGYGVYLPISIHTYKDVIDRLKLVEAGESLLLESYMSTDYFEDKTNQKMCVDFMNSKNK